MPSPSLPCCKTCHFPIKLFPAPFKHYYYTTTPLHYTTLPYPTLLHHTSVTVTITVLYFAVCGNNKHSRTQSITQSHGVVVSSVVVQFYLPTPSAFFLAGLQRNKHSRWATKRHPGGIPLTYIHTIHTIPYIYTLLPYILSYIPSIPPLPPISPLQALQALDPASRTYRKSR